MPASDRRYCAIGLYYDDAPDKPEILAIEGQIVLFDTLTMAQEVVPRLGGGRIPHWDKTQEVCGFSPLIRRGFNRIAIFTNYDPYDVPNGFRAKGVWSEAEGRDWKHHTMYFEHVPTLLAWVDQMALEAFPALSEPALTAL